MLKKQISSLFSNLQLLDARSKDIITSRWLLDEKLTLKEIAEKYSISAERVRQLEFEALAKLRQHIIQ